MQCQCHYRDDEETKPLQRVTRRLVSSRQHSTLRFLVECGKDRVHLQRGGRAHPPPWSTTSHRYVYAALRSSLACGGWCWFSSCYDQRAPRSSCGYVHPYSTLSHADTAAWRTRSVEAVLMLRKPLPAGPAGRRLKSGVVRHIAAARRRDRHTAGTLSSCMAHYPPSFATWGFPSLSSAPHGWVMSGGGASTRVRAAQHHHGAFARAVGGAHPPGPLQLPRQGVLFLPHRPL